MNLEISVVFTPIMTNHYFQIFLSFFLLIFISCKQDFTPHKAKSGVMDLRNWNPLIETVISLDGNWEFYWNELYTDSSQIKMEPAYADLPSSWNNKIIQNQKLTGTGFATYRLRVLLPENLSVPTLAIRVKPLTNCKIFINGKELNCIGILGQDFTSSVPDTRPSFASFSTDQRTLDILIQVSNFHHRKGGFLYSIYFGTEAGLYKYIQNIRSRDDFILGFLFFVILYHIGLFLIRRNETLSIQFTLLVILIFLRTATTGEKLLADYLPIHYPIYVAIEYITFFLVMPLALQFLNNMFSLRLPKWVIGIPYLVGFAFSLVTIFTDTIFYSNLVNFYLPVFIFELAISYLLVCIAYYQKKENAGMILVGITVMLFCAINDILNTTEILHTSYIAHYGLICIVFSQSLYLLMRFVKAFQRIEVLSADLKRSNEDLENRILERTKEIMEEKIMAVKANELKDKFISLLSHDLRSPIGNAKMLIESSIDSDNETEKGLSRSYLELAIKSIENSLEMTDKILQFSQTNSGNIELNIHSCNPSSIIDKVFNIMLSRVREKEIQLLSFVPEEETIQTDEALLQEVILNLVSNSIKFCNAGDMISVSSSQSEDKYILSVKDTGIGIPKEMQVNIFSHVIKTSSKGTAGEAGTGLGLPLCRDIVKMLHGEIWLNEQNEKGTEFIVTLPLNFNNSSGK